MSGIHILENINTAELARARPTFMFVLGPSAEDGQGCGASAGGSSHGHPDGILGSEGGNGRGPE